MEQGRSATSPTTSSAFAAWVAPVAAQMRGARDEVIEFARAQDGDFWSQKPRGADGWTNKDLLAHVGGGNDQMLQLILRAVIAKQPIGASVTTMDTDAENARGVEERHDWPFEQVIAELESSGDEMQSLLGQLTDGDRDRTLEGLNITLEQLMAVVQAEDHDREHLAQLRATLERAG
jgi:hypothetical protein